MAAKLQSSRVAASFGKRFLTQISSLDSLLITPSVLSIRRRSVHVWVYDKNPEEEVRVADDVIPGDQHYWCPHPQTGVFGPAKDHKPAERGLHVKADSDSDSVLEQKAFFRPLEDLDKPLHA